MTDPSTRIAQLVFEFRKEQAQRSSPIPIPVRYGANRVRYSAEDCHPFDDAPCAYRQTRFDLDADCPLELPAGMVGWVTIDGLLAPYCVAADEVAGSARFASCDEEMCPIYDGDRQLWVIRTTGAVVINIGPDPAARTIVAQARRSKAFARLDGGDITRQ